MPFTQFFDLFPKVQYDITGAQYPTYETATNIFHRLGYLKDVLQNVSAYYLYEIQDNDTPEILAEKFYGDPGAGWMIIYANNIIDPQWNWPLDDETFKDYIINKYGSISAAVNQIDHYNKVVISTVDGESTTKRYRINAYRLTNNIQDVPYEYYYPYKTLGGITVDTTSLKADTTTIKADNDCFDGDTSLSQYDSYEYFNVNNKTVTVDTYGEKVTCYDYEQELNENKRTIKVIKAAYYNQIMKEFKTLTKGLPSYVRTFK